MISVLDKRNCCGCTACKSICPKSCIQMEFDSEGFLYPIVNKSSCIDCGLCEKICPIINPFDGKEYALSCYASRSKQFEIVKKSSSGGLFSVLAQEVLHEGGCVVGAAFRNDWSVHHIVIDDLESLDMLRESKYVQSDLEDVFKQVKQILKEGRKVLFVGTPCQVAGINHYIGKDENLVTVDLICHSSPSPKIWREYLDEVTKKDGGVNKISKLSFRDKTFGWRKFSLIITTKSDEGKEKVLIHEDSGSNLYMQGFLQDLFDRPSCTQCPARNYKSGSDITLGDCWAVEKYYPQYKDDEIGLSVVLINSPKGQEVFNKVSNEVETFEMQYEEVEPRNMHAPLTKSTGPHPLRSVFFKLKDIIPISILVYCCLTPVKIWRNIISFSKKSIRRIIGESIYDSVKSRIRK